MFQVTDGTPIAALTVGQFKELFHSTPTATPEIIEPTPPPERRTLHSIRELSDFIGCSTVTAQKIKNSGRIPFRQVGRKVMFDTADVLKAMEQPKKKSLIK